MNKTSGLRRLCHVTQHIHFHCVLQTDRTWTVVRSQCYTKKKKNKSWNMDLCNRTCLCVFYIRLNQEMNMQNFLDAFQQRAQILFCIHKPFSKKKIVFLSLCSSFLIFNLKSSPKANLNLADKISHHYPFIQMRNVFLLSFSLSRFCFFKAFFMLRAVLVKWMCTLKSRENVGNGFF